MSKIYPAEPYKIKVVENIHVSTREERVKYMEEAGFRALPDQIGSYPQEVK